jgi:cytochrome c peroxidase
MSRIISIMGIAIAMHFMACTKSDAVRNDLIGTPIPFVVPGGFPAEHIFVNAPLTREGIELGKKIFYDGRLSKDGSISCGSCHQQAAAFGTFDHDLSHGIYNQHSNRNAPPLFHLAWQKSFGWDGRYGSMEAMAEAHILSATDMAGNFSEIVARMKGDPHYPPLFEAAYGSGVINKERMLKALAQFTGSIMSITTRYDSVQAGLAAFTVSESVGYQLFKQHCNTCHTEPLFTDGSFRNNGLPFTLLNDKGRQNVTGNSSDRYFFKVPSLRNLYLSYPFMHDGRLIAFSQVYDHYASVTTQNNGGLIDTAVKSGIPLTTDERNKLTDFLKTLTDYRLSGNEAYKP